MARKPGGGNPYWSKDQRHFFLACEHGWNPPSGKKCPPGKVTDSWENQYDASGKPWTKTKKGCGRKKKRLLPLD